MIDISYAGANVQITAQDGSMTNFTINEFSDEGSPVQISDFDIADGSMNLNGILVTWTKAQAVEFSLTLIPNSEGQRRLGTFLVRHAIGGKGAIPEAFISRLLLSIPAAIGVSGTGEKGARAFVFMNGRMRSGAPAIGTNSEGKMNAMTYNFVFERVDEI